MDRKILRFIRVGMSFRLSFGKGHPYTRRLHVRAIVDETEDGCWIVFCWYSRRKGWKYDIKHSFEFEDYHDRGHIESVRKSNFDE